LSIHEQVGLNILSVCQYARQSVIRKSGYLDSCVSAQSNAFESSTDGEKTLLKLALLKLAFH